MARRISHAIGWLLMAALTTITAPASPGTETYSLGFRPVALIVWGNGLTAGGLAEGYRVSRGFSDGVTQACRGAGCEDNAASPAGYQLERTNRIYELATPVASGSATVLQSAELVEFTDDGFELEWHEADGIASRITVLAIAEGEVTHVKLVSVFCDGNPEVVTGVGFAPEAILTIPGTTTDLGGYAAGAFAAMVAIGVSDGVDNYSGDAYARLSGATSGASEYHAGLSGVVRYISSFFEGQAAVALGIQNVGPDGFEVGKGGFGAASLCHHFLCLGGLVNVAVGAVAQGAQGATTSLGLSFAPSVVFLQSVGDVAGGGGVGGAWMAAGAWLADQTVRSDFAGVYNPGATRSASTRSEARALRLYLPEAAAASSSAVMDASLAADGSAITWDTSDGTARVVFFLALGLRTPPSCSGGTVPSVADPEDGDAFEGLGPHEDRVFIETDLDDDEVARWALQTAMRDSPGLEAHPGFKAGVITQIGSIIRRTTGRLGAWQASSVRWAKDDHDKVARDLFDRLHWYGREFRVYLAKRTGVATARILGRFFTSQYAPTQGFSAEVEGLDIVGSEFSPLALTRDIMAGAVFDRDRVPEAPVDLLDQDPPQPIPIYMGRWSDEGSDEAPVSLIGAAWRKADPDVFWRMGFANMVSVGGIEPPPAPDDITLTLLSGGSIQVSPLSTRLCVQVWAVTDGVQGDPAPFLGRNKTVTITGNNRVKVDIDWAGPDPDTWRIGVGYIYFNERWTQVVEIAGSLRTFTLDNTPIFPDAGGGATTGGTQIGVFYDKHTYRVVKVTADGRTTATPLCHMNTGPYARPAHISFQDVAEDTALRYEAYGTTKDPAGSPTAKEFIWRWTAPTDQIDSDGYHYILDHFDGTGRETLTEGMPAPQGMLPVWDTGDVMFDGMLMGRLVMARWNWHRVISVYAGETRLADNHPDLRHADHSSWPQASRVITLDDVDCMVLFVRVGSTILANHREGTAEIRVNACTTEDVGDGTGSTIAQSARAMRHLWERLVIQDHLSGPWIASPTFPDGTPMVRGSDFANAELMQIARVGGDGYPARIALIAPTALGQFIQDGVQSYGLHHGIGWHGQIRCGHYDDAVDTTQGYPHFTHVRAIKGHLTIRPLTEDYENAIPSQWDFRPTTAEYAVKRTVPKDMVKDDAAIARNFGKRRVGPLRSLPYCGNEQTYTDVMQRNLLLGRFVNEWIEVPTDITLGLTVDLFSIILVSDPEGTGANGYQETFVLVLEHEVVIGDPVQQRPTMVLLKGLNITKLIDAAWVWAPDDAPDTWDDLTDEQKGQYAGWADDDDEIPSTDDPAKEWR